LTLHFAGSYTSADTDAPTALIERTARSCVDARFSREHTQGPEAALERIARNPDEADLPAQEATSREGARLPGSNEDDRRATRDRRPTRSRPQAADGLIDGRDPAQSDWRSRLVMLTRPQDFAALQSEGTTRSHPLLAVRVRRTDLETTRFGLATGRKLGTAVVRNRIRRRLREALRVMAPSFQPGWDVLIIARPGLIDTDQQTLVGTLRRLLNRGGVLGGPAQS
jgi:ribonuclease P protein component